jgi:hypothetical protein
LASLSENAAVAVMPTATALPLTLVPPAKPKHTMLPVLIVLFLISYGLMCLLVVEQGTTIDNQRFLIRQLLGDSTQLSAMKGKAIQEQQAQAQAKAQADARAQQSPSARNHSGKGSSNGKMRRPAPQRPPTDTSDAADERRTLISI